MNYEESMEYIKKAESYGSVLGLNNIKELLRRLGNPQDQLPVVHIAGTNGKGSILSYMESVLETGGYVVGRYISPTVFGYLERFQVNREYMHPETFASLLTQVSGCIEDMLRDGHVHPTPFEIETALAFLFFIDKKVDIILLETGLGGRLDATNVVTSPICEIIASISMDHMQFLGTKLEDITKEKAGIIKEGSQVVLYPCNGLVEDVIENTCVAKSADLHKIDKADINFLDYSIDGQKFLYKNRMFHISLMGEHQVYNAATAIEALDWIRETFSFREENLSQGLRKAVWPGRFEVISYEPLFIRDGAHNEDAARMLALSVEKYFTNKAIIYIMGVLADKEYDKILQITAPFAAAIITITPNNIRALSGEVLAEAASKYCDNVIAVNSLKEAIDLAKQTARKEDVILAFGSLSFIGEL